MPSGWFQPSEEIVRSRMSGFLALARNDSDCSHRFRKIRKGDAVAAELGDGVRNRRKGLFERNERRLDKPTRCLPRRFRVPVNGVVSAAGLPFRGGVAQTIRRFFSLGTQRKECSRQGC